MSWQSPRCPRPVQAQPERGGSRVEAMHHPARVVVEDHLAVDVDAHDIGASRGNELVRDGLDGQITIHCHAPFSLSGEAEPARKSADRRTRGERRSGVAAGTRARCERAERAWSRAGPSGWRSQQTVPVTRRSLADEIPIGVRVGPPFPRVQWERSPRQSAQPPGEATKYRCDRRLVVKAAQGNDHERSRFLAVGGGQADVGPRRNVGVPRVRA